jgi:hypothetical protein
MFRQSRVSDFGHSAAGKSPGPCDVRGQAKKEASYVWHRLTSIFRLQVYNTISHSLLSRAKGSEERPQQLENG